MIRWGRTGEGVSSGPAEPIPTDEKPGPLRGAGLISENHRRRVVVRSELRRSSRYAGSPGGEPMPKRHIVQLTDDQREALVRREHGPPTRRRRNRVQILLRHDGGGTDEQIADELGICVGTVTNVRRRSTLGGVEAALDEKPRPGSRPAARRQGRGDRHHRAVQALGEQLLLAVDPCPARLLLVSESRLASASQDCSQSRFEQRLESGKPSQVTIFHPGRRNRGLGNSPENRRFRGLSGYRPFRMEVERSWVQILPSRDERFSGPRPRIS